jgi:hypothetical protein
VNSVRVTIVSSNPSCWRFFFFFFIIIIYLLEVVGVINEVTTLLCHHRKAYKAMSKPKTQIYPYLINTPCTLRRAV